MDSTPPEAPWFKHLWPWLIMAPPLASVIAGMALLWIAIASNDGLVAFDYEKDRSAQAGLTPEQAANCAVKDRACLNTPVEDR